MVVSGTMHTEYESTVVKDSFHSLIVLNGNLELLNVKMCGTICLQGTKTICGMEKFLYPVHRIGWDDDTDLS